MSEPGFFTPAETAAALKPAGAVVPLVSLNFAVTGTGILGANPAECKSLGLRIFLTANDAKRHECLGCGLFGILVVPDDVGFGAAIIDAVPADRVELVAAVVGFLVAHRLVVDGVERDRSSEFGS